MTATASVLVCRGCCCGTDDPVAAARRVDVLGAAATSLPTGRITLTNCLGPCGERDIVAIRHRDTDRPGKPLATTWLRGVDDATVAVLDVWVRRGADGSVPGSIAAQVFDPAALDVTPDDSITTSDRAVNGVVPIDPTTP